MARLGRGFPTHTKIRKAGLSNYTVTLSVVSSTVSSLLKQKSLTMLVACATVATLASLRLKSINTLAIVSATSLTLAKVTGAGRILSVTSSTTLTMSRQVSKLLSLSSPVVLSLTKTISKTLSRTVSVTARILPGLFRIAPSKSVLLIQFRPFTLIVFNRIVRQ